MNLNSENRQVVHEVVIADMQKRLYEDGKGIIFTNDNEYTTYLESIVEATLHTNSIPNNKNVISFIIYPYSILCYILVSRFFTLNLLLNSNICTIVFY